MHKCVSVWLYLDIFRHVILRFNEEKAALKFLQSNYTENGVFGTFDWRVGVTLL